MLSHAEAEQMLLQAGIGGEGLHAAGMRHLAVVHDGHGVAELAGEDEVLLDHQQLVAPSFSSRKASIMWAMMAGARPLVGSSIRSSRRGSMMARATASICFWPPDRWPAGSCQKRFSASKRLKIQSSRFGSGGPARAASTRFSCTVRSAKIAMLSGT